MQSPLPFSASPEPGTKSLSLQGSAGGTGRWHCQRVIVEVDHINAADD